MAGYFTVGPCAVILHQGASAFISVPSFYGKNRADASRLEIIKYLSKTKKGLKSLIYSSYVYNDLKAVKFLTSKGVDLLNLPQNQSGLARSTAQMGRFLISLPGGMAHIKKRKVIERGASDLKFLEFLLSLGVNVHFDNDVLLRLCTDIEVARRLILYGLNINAKYSRDNKPLLLAADEGHLDLIKYLAPYAEEKVYKEKEFLELSSEHEDLLAFLNLPHAERQKIGVRLNRILAIRDNIRKI